MTAESGIRTVAFRGNYLPRKCGIATFTSDLLGAVAARHPQNWCFAVPINDVEGCYQYPEIVRYEIEGQDLATYRGAADFLNSSNVDVVSLQHECGIFGGPAGSLVHGGQLIIPYGISDHATTFATVPLEQVLGALE